MCSTPQERIAAFGRAIEDFASRTRSEAIAADRSAGSAAAADGDGMGEHAPAIAEVAPGNSPRPAGREVSTDALSRLAELWAELAALDPEIAKRLPTYEA
jgi:hypothetical protein